MGRRSCALCRMHRLHNRNMAEMAALHAQLRRIVSQKFEGTDFSLGMKAQLPPLVSLTLKRAMTSGWADQVLLLVNVFFTHLFAV